MGAGVRKETELTQPVEFRQINDRSEDHGVGHQWGSCKTDATIYNIPGIEKGADRQHQLMASILLDQEADHEKCRAREP